ncbi:MAG TPA: Uma2 family endonuclease, partial [Gemmatimonadales bacterium]|jgi:Uma2 family endonuclease
MGMAAPSYYTAQMVRALPDDGNRYEVVHGELLVTPAPRGWHQLLVLRLATALRNYLDDERLGVVLMAPADISWGLEDVLVQPDVFVFPRDEARTMEWHDIHTLLLAIEVLSPSSERADRFTKRRLYQERRVATYWIVNAEQQRVEVWAPDETLPRIERERLIWQAPGVAEPFVLELEALFRPI